MTYTFAIFLMLLTAFVLSGATCFKDSATAPADDCDSKNKVTATGKKDFVLSKNVGAGTEQSYYFETDKPVNNNCHGSFAVELEYATDRAVTDTSEPPVKVEFGTDFILGSGFTLTKYRSETGASYRWVYLADEGAKNLSDDATWHYTVWIESLSDSLAAAVRVREVSITYIPK